MFTAEIFQLALILAAFLCSLVAGLLFGFAVVVMPGIGRLQDRAFLRAFQEMDRIIQNNQPLFMLVWLGSVAALVTAAALGFFQLAGGARWMLIVAALAYLVGAQLPTVTINIPLNNRLQTLDIDALDGATRDTERKRFEPRWVRWNTIRTAFAGLASALLMTLLWLN